jgi:hypothetical protein
LSASQVIPAARNRATQVSVAILNEKGDVEYTDADLPEKPVLKLIEGGEPA